MALQTWVTLANAYQFSSVAEGVELKETVTKTDISPGGKTVGEAFTLPAGFLNPGSVLRYTAMGWYGTTGVPTLELGLYYEGVAGKALAVSKIESSETVTEVPWRLEATTRILPLAVQPATEAFKSAKAITQGMVIGIGKSTTDKGGEKEPTVVTNLPLTKPQTEVAIDLTKQNIITIGATWGTSNAANKIVCTQWYVEILN